MSPPAEHEAPPSPAQKTVWSTPDANPWIASGLLGGALAGVIDAGFALLGRIGGVSVGKGILLVVIEASLLAATGALVGALTAIGAMVVRLTRAPARWGPVAWAAAASPIVIADAFALFAGGQASKLPGHRAISAGLAVAGLVAIAFAARLYRRRLGRRARDWLTFWALAALAIAAELVNRNVLPRLYRWFHDTLGVLTVVCLVLAVRAVLAEVRSRRLAIAVAATALAATGAILQLRSSQVLRYATHERTAVGGLVLRRLPAALHSRRIATTNRPAAPGALAPLPSGPRLPQADVLLITIDALRADHVGAYGYRRPTTPNIDALAASGTRFVRAYAQAPHTSFSVASMLTGKYFPTLARLAPGERHDPLPAVLRTYGWKTAAFYPPAVFFVDAHKLKAYADSNFDFEYVKFEYLEAPKRVDQVLAYYHEVQPDRAFVWVHLFEPHEPYESHPEHPFGTGDIDRYDSEIALADAAVGRLVKEVRARRPETIVIVTADHGEEFDEHGGRYHGSTLFEEQVQVPLVISVPGAEPQVIDGQVELIDIAPTVLNLLDIPVPVRMRGTDLGPWLASPPAPAARLPPAYAEVEDKRMVVFGTEKLICDLNWGFCAYHDLRADPREQRNLAEERPDRTAAMRALLDDWLDGHVRFEPLLAKGASNPDGGPVPKAIERGRLGDLLAGPDLGTLMNDAAAPMPQRREAAELLVALPARREVAEALARGAKDPDKLVADWAAVGAVRLGDKAARPRVQALAADLATPARLRVRAALALATVGDATGLPALGEALESCENDVLLCRLIILNLGKLKDRRAVPILLKHLGEVQNRREMVDALGDIGDPAAADALLERLRRDEYVPVRVQAARALGKIGDARVVGAIEAALRHETEPTVITAARETLAGLRAGARNK